MKLKYAILILNYNSKDDIIRCLKILKILPKIYTTIVVDNASSDDSVNLLKKNFPELILIENKKNVGFAVGNNIGIRYLLDLGAEKILLLNSDTEFTDKDIERLFTSNADITGPVLKFMRGFKTIYDLGGHINQILGRTFHEEVFDKKDITFRKPDYISGAVMLINREVFTTIGLFDDDYFLYYEDSDFCNRARDKGFKIKLMTQIIIEHKLSNIIGRHSFIGLSQNLRSNLLFINKNINWYFKPIAWCYWGILACKVSINYILSSKIK